MNNLSLEFLRLNLTDVNFIFSAYGLILNSHHFFTFDRKHFAFKGSCSYVLAQDFHDGNFSIIANLDGGKLKSITVHDKVDSVEILNDNTVSFFSYKPKFLKLIFPLSWCFFIKIKNFVLLNFRLA